MTKTFLIVAIFISLLSCFSKSDKEIPIPAGYSRLGIQLDSNENFFVDSFGVSPNIDQRRYILTSDKENKNLMYVFDSIPNGRLTFVVSSLFNKTYSKKITLISDSVFFVSKTDLFDFVRDSSFELLENSELDSDTLSIVYQVRGCFDSFFERTTISKNNNKYIVDFFKNDREIHNNPVQIKKEFDSGFKKTIDLFKTNCKKYVLNKGDNAKKDIFRFSTLSQVIYINKGNRVYIISNNEGGNWDLYETFIAKIIG